MSTEENKAVFQKLIELQEHGDLNMVDQVIAPNWVNHDGSVSPLQGPEGFKRLTMGFRSAFSDIRLEIEDMLAEGDKVAARWTAVSFEHRVTNVYRREAGGWKRVYHHHSDPSPAMQDGRERLQPPPG
jgi:predicted ester cyclase